MYLLFLILLLTAPIAVANCWEAASFINSTSATTNIAKLSSPMPRFVISELDFNEIKKAPRNINNNNKNLVTILSSINYGGEYFPAGPVCSEAMELAFDRLRRAPNWLPNYDIAMELIDDECADGTAITKLATKMNENNDALNRLPLLFPVDCATIGQYLSAALAKHYNFLSMSVIPASPELYYDRRMYSNFFGMGERGDIAYIAFAEFCINMGWRKVAIISELNSYYNMIDKYFLKILEDRNISVVWMSKIPYRSEDAEILSNAFEEMASRNPHIIVSNTDSPITVACFMHRYGLVGPAYKVFVTYWTVVEPDTDIPPFMNSWCTKEMLNQVLENVFFYGDALISDMYGDTVPDSTGMVFSDFWRNLRKKIANPEESSAWSYWPPLCYDRALVAGIVLNVTETILQRRNETLTDWTTNTTKFQQNPDYILNVLQEAIYSVDVTGFKGEYKMNRSTTVNSGYVPMTFSQYQTTDNVNGTKLVFVAAYKSNERQPLVIMRDINWHTTHGRPPKDSVVVIMIATARISTATFSVLVSLGVVELVVCLLLVILSVTKRWLPLCFWLLSLTAEDTDAISGCFVMLLHIATLSDRVTPKSVDINCSVMAILVIFGFSMSTSALLVKLETGNYNNNQQARSASRQSVRRTSSRQRRQSSYQRFKQTFTTKLAYFPPIWSLSQVVLLGAYIGTDPILTTRVTNDGGEHNNEPDSSGIIYQPFNYVCDVDTNGNRSLTGFSILICIVVLQLFILVRAGILAFRFYSLEAGSVNVVLKKTSACIYCQLLVLLAGLLIAVLDFGYLHIVISSVVIANVAVNIYFITILARAFCMVGVQAERTRQSISISTSAQRDSNNNNIKAGTRITIQHT